MTVRPSAWFIAVPPDGAARETGFETAAAFESVLGRDSCKVFDSRKYLEFFHRQLKIPEETLVVDLFNQALAVQCLDFGAGYARNCLVCALCPVTLFTLNLFRSHGVKTCHWFYEDYRKALYWKYMLAGYDHFFAIQKGPIPEACRQAGSAYSYLPTATAAGNCCAPDAPLTATKDSGDRQNDIAFIGIPSLYRIEVLEYLAGLGFSLQIAGFGWDRYNGPLKASVVNNFWTGPSQALGLLKKSKVGINLSITPPDADRQNTHVSPRVFDVLASGCVLVTEDVPLTAETLKNLHYHTFTDKQDAGRRISEILSGMDREKAFFESNRGAICREHSYENRVREILHLTKGI